LKRIGVVILKMTGGFLGRRLPHFLFLHHGGAAVTLKAAGGGGNVRSSDEKTLGPAITCALPSLYGRIADGARAARS
jgi:hypothetical protein